MTTAIFIFKVIITLIFTFTGITKIYLPKAKLIEKGMKGLMNLGKNTIQVIGLLEVLGALGLILPSILNISPILSAFSALCLSLTMLIAAGVNHKLKLSIIPNIVIFVICILIAIWDIKAGLQSSILTQIHTII